MTDAEHIAAAKARLKASGFLDWILSMPPTEATQQGKVRGKYGPKKGQCAAIKLLP